MTSLALLAVAAVLIAVAAAITAVAVRSRRPYWQLVVHRDGQDSIVLPYRYESYSAASLAHAIHGVIDVDARFEIRPYRGVR